MHNKLLAPFLAWSGSQGITTPLQLVETDSYRYMALPDGDSTFFQPSSDSTDFVNIVKVPLDACLIGDDWQALTDRLKHEKSLGEESKFAPWIDMLPKLEAFQGMPRFWSRERREFVQQYDGGQLEARMVMDQLRFEIIDDPWALACVDSRSNFLPDKTYSMTPMLDMFNHDSRIRTTANVNEDRELFLNVSSKAMLSIQEETEEAQDFQGKMLNFFLGSSAAKSKTQANQEVYISYGELTNLETLCNYGFVSSNTCNTETFQVRMMGKSPTGLIVDSSGSIDNTFNQMELSTLRYNLATSSELESLETSSEDFKISERNEAEVYALIAGELEEAVYESKIGVESAEEVEDTLVATYLRERKNTLQVALDRIKGDYPELF